MERFSYAAIDFAEGICCSSINGDFTGDVWCDWETVDSILVVKYFRIAGFLVTSFGTVTCGILTLTSSRGLVEGFTAGDWNCFLRGMFWYGLCWLGGAGTSLIVCNCGLDVLVGYANILFWREFSFSIEKFTAESQSISSRPVANFVDFISFLLSNLWPISCFDGCCLGTVDFVSEEFCLTNTLAGFSIPEIYWNLLKLMRFLFYWMVCILWNFEALSTSGDSLLCSPNMEILASWLGVSEPHLFWCIPCFQLRGCAAMVDCLYKFLLGY